MSKNQKIIYLIIGVLIISILILITNSQIQFSSSKVTIENIPSVGTVENQQINNCNPQQGFQNYYVDKNSLCGSCSDSYTKQQNSVTQPWCTLEKAASESSPGDAVFIQEGKYDENVNFVNSGTPSQRITFTGLGEVILGYYREIEDSQLSLSQYPNVYQININPTNIVNLYQNYFDPIIIDDPDSTPFSLIEENGPIELNKVTDFTTLEDIDGTWLIQGSSLYIHPYNNRVPSDSNTDFVAGLLGGASVIDEDYLIFQNLTFRYYEHGSSWYEGQNADSTVFKNIKATAGWFLGSNTLLEDSKFSNSIKRKNDALYSATGTTWSCNGCFTNTGTTVFKGTNQKIRNVEVFGGGDLFGANAIGLDVDGLLLHGSYNHCWLPSDSNDLSVKNMVSYGCQDGPGFLSGLNNATFDHVTIESSIVVQEYGGVVTRDLNFKNSILTSCTINMPSGPHGVSCEWEGSTRFDNVIFFCNPGQELQIEHCLSVDGSGYYQTEVYNGINDYLANCASSGAGYCMEFNNIQLIQSNDHSNVILGGRWNGFHPWDYHITDENSPAHDSIFVSDATIDIEKDLRPQGLAYDIGADEYNEGASSATCGNNIIEAGEQCDNSNLNGQTCQTQGYDTGNLNCYPQGHPQECMFDTNQCSFNSPSCTLTNAYWNTTTANEGDYVSLVVEGNNCDGEPLVALIWEDDLGEARFFRQPFADDFITGFSSIFNGNTVEIAWQTYFDDEFGSNSEYYFNVELVNDPSEVTQSNQNLIVSEDTTSPIISNVNSNPFSNSAIITWDTNENSDSYIEYGISPGNYQDVNFNFNFVTSHQITLTDLLPNTRYYYRIHSSDFANNLEISQEYFFDTNNEEEFEITNLVINNQAWSGNNYEIVYDNLNSGNLIYVDRTHSFTNIPSYLVGSTYIKTANSDKNSNLDNFISFDINVPATVYIAHDDRVIEKPDWLLTFTNLNELIDTTDTDLYLFSKSFSSGSVVLGGNRVNLDDYSMYSIIIVPDFVGQEPTEICNNNIDDDSDNFVDCDDLDCKSYCGGSSPIFVKEVG